MLVKHREELYVFVDKPFVPMDNNRGELSGICPKVGDSCIQSATWSCLIPSRTSIPSMTSGSRLGPEIRRHFLLADIISLQAMASAVRWTGRQRNSSVTGGARRLRSASAVRALEES